MTLDHANEYPDVLSRHSERNQPSGRTQFSGAVSTERDGTSIFMWGSASPADRTRDRQADEAAEYLYKDLQV